MDTVLPGVIAFSLGLIVAVGAFVPWMAWEYRHRGHLGIRRSLVAFGTIVYALALVTYTLLPLPDDVTTMCRNPTTVQLRLFAFLSDIAKEGGITSPRSLLGNPASAQVVFNVLLFVPLGALVRHAVARRRMFAGILVGLGAGFVISLLIELTQLTGDWSLYPCAYRLFDVDDLLANTTGAILGTFLGPMVGLLAGSGRASDTNVPRQVTAARRLSGMFADVLAISLLSGTLKVVTVLVLALANPALDILLTSESFIAPTVQLVIVLVSGRTLGEHAVRLRPSERPEIGKRILRWAFGSGGWVMLLTINSPVSNFVAIVIAVVSTIAVWTTRGRRGLALTLTRLDIEDDRIDNPSIPGHHPRVPQSEPTAVVPVGSSANGRDHDGGPKH